MSSTTAFWYSFKKTRREVGPPLMMFKALLEQSWYKLSDPALEKQLSQGILLRRLTGLDVSVYVPDSATFWKFSQRLEKMCLMEGLLNEISCQLSKQGLYIKSEEVSIIDNRITKRAYRNEPLEKKIKHFNRTHPSARCTVKRVFCVLRQHYGMASTRYLGLSRNSARFELMCMAHNLKR